MKNCKLCNKALKGRSDRKYCSSHCKNQYHQQLRKTNATIVDTIDQFLHRNRAILLELLLEYNQQKMMISKTKLEKMGFRFSNFTGTHINSKGKTFHHVYDYSWMEFTSKEILVIKR